VTGAEFKRNTHRISARTIGWCVTIGMTLVACTPAEAPLPSGHISLVYVGILGSNVEFRLENGSSKTIRFRGLYTRPDGADPWDTQIVCRAANGTTGYDHSIAVVVGEPASIKVHLESKCACSSTPPGTKALTVTFA
jgi:hypothetical protein